MNLFNKISPLILLLIFCTSCVKQVTPQTLAFETVGKIERLDKALDAIISPDAVIEVLSTAHAWSEGPIWDAEEQRYVHHNLDQLYVWAVFYPDRGLIGYPIHNY